jgi:hypothetical protein
MEHRPADVVPEPLVVQHKLADRRGQMVALPSAFEPAALVAALLRRGRACGADRVRRCTELVGGDMSDSGGLAGGVRGLARRPFQVPSGGVGVTGGGPCLGHAHLAAHPRTYLLDRPTRAVVGRPHLLEEGQDVLRTIGGPLSEKAVIGILESAAAANGDESRVALLRKDHL